MHFKTNKCYSNGIFWREEPMLSGCSMIVTPHIHHWKYILVNLYYCFNTCLGKPAQDDHQIGDTNATTAKIMMMGTKEAEIVSTADYYIGTAARGVHDPFDSVLFFVYLCIPALKSLYRKFKLYWTAQAPCRGDDSGSWKYCCLYHCPNVNNAEAIVKRTVDRRLHLPSSTKCLKLT